MLPLAAVRNHDRPLSHTVFRAGADGGPGQDRAAVFARGRTLVAVVADGAGGMSGGAAAADAAVAAVARALDRPDFDPFAPLVWTDVLGDCDRELGGSSHGGQTTAVVAAVDEERLEGASVGDSGAWLVTDNGYQDLSRAQRRRPLLGSGAALPVGFTSEATGGTLLLATDGLLHYARPSAICRIAGGPSLQVAPEFLVSLVRLRSGTLPDDVGLVLCRRERPL